jgi:hypothetical protein
MPRFPAIAICPGDSFWVVQSMPEGGSPAAIRSGYFNRLYLYDSDGKRWRVASVEATSARPKGPFGRLIGVQLSLAPPEQPPLSEIAADLCNLVDADPDDLYEQFITRDELKRRFGSAVTCSDLITAAATLGDPY